jgi:hypothetical protein
VLVEAALQAALFNGRFSRQGEMRNFGAVQKAAQWLDAQRLHATAQQTQHV